MACTSLQPCTLCDKHPVCLSLAADFLTLAQLCALPCSLVTQQQVTCVV
jgi:hypothetical protein